MSVSGVLQAQDPFWNLIQVDVDAVEKEIESASKRAFNRSCFARSPQEKSHKNALSKSANSKSSKVSKRLLFDDEDSADISKPNPTKPAKQSGKVRQSKSGLDKRYSKVKFAKMDASSDTSNNTTKFVVEGGESCQVEPQGSSEDGKMKQHIVIKETQSKGLEQKAMPAASSEQPPVSGEMKSVSLTAATATKEKQKADGETETTAGQEGVSSLPTEATLHFLWSRTLPIDTSAVCLLGPFSKEPILLKLQKERDVYQSKDMTVLCGDYTCRMMAAKHAYKLEKVQIRHYTFEVDLFIEEEEESRVLNTVVERSDSGTVCKPVSRNLQQGAAAAPRGAGIKEMDDVLEGEPESPVNGGGGDDGIGNRRSSGSSRGGVGIRHSKLYEKLVMQQMSNGETRSQKKGITDSSVQDVENVSVKSEHSRGSHESQSERGGRTYQTGSLDRLNKEFKPIPSGGTDSEWDRRNNSRLSMNSSEVELGQYFDHSGNGRRSLDILSDSGHRSLDRLADSGRRSIDRLSSIPPRSQSVGTLTQDGQQNSDLEYAHTTSLDRVAHRKDRNGAYPDSLRSHDPEASHQTERSRKRLDLDSNQRHSTPLDSRRESRDDVDRHGSAVRTSTAHRRQNPYDVGDPGPRDSGHSHSSRAGEADRRDGAAVDYPSRAAPGSKPSIRTPLVTSRTTPVSTGKPGSRMFPPGVERSRDMNEGQNERVHEMETAMLTLKRELTDQAQEAQEARERARELEEQLRLARNANDIMNTNSESEKEKKLFELIRDKENLTTELWKQRHQQQQRDPQSSDVIDSGHQQVRDGDESVLPLTNADHLDNYSPNNPNALQRKIEELEAQIQDLQEANESTINNLSRTEEEVSHLKDENLNMRVSGGHRLGDLEEENRVLREEIQRLRLDGLTSPIEDDPAALKRDLRQLREELRGLRDKNHILMQDNIKLTEHLKDLERLRSHSDDEHEDASRARRELQFGHHGTDNNANYRSLEPRVNGVEEEKFGVDRRQVTQELNHLDSLPRWRDAEGKGLMDHEGENPYPREHPDERLSQGRKDTERTLVNGHAREVSPSRRERKMSECSNSTVELMSASPLGDQHRHETIDCNAPPSVQERKKLNYSNYRAAPERAPGLRPIPVSSSSVEQESTFDVLASLPPIHTDQVDDVLDSLPFPVSRGRCKVDIVNDVVSERANASPRSRESLTPTNSISATEEPERANTVCDPTGSERTKIVKTDKGWVDLDQTPTEAMPNYRLAPSRAPPPSPQRDQDVRNGTGMDTPPGGNEQHSRDNSILDDLLDNSHESHEGEAFSRIHNGFDFESLPTAGYPRRRRDSVSSDSTEAILDAADEEIWKHGPASRLREPIRGSWAVTAPAMHAAPVRGEALTPPGTHQRMRSPGQPSSLRSLSPKPTVTQHNKGILGSPTREESHSTSKKRPFAPRAPADINIGDVVKFCRHGGKISKGAVLYIGHLPGKNDTYLGMELEHEMGKHDGVYETQRYFQCKPNRGVFVAFSKVVMAWGE